MLRALCVIQAVEMISIVGLILQFRQLVVGE